MKLKRFIALAAATAAIGGALAGCGKDTATVDTAEIMARENIEEYKYPEQIELRIPVYDRGNPGQANVTDNYWTQYVQKEFGDKHNIKMTFVSIPRKEEVTKFNQLLAGKAENQTDIIFNYDYPTIVSFADQGAFQTLDEEMIKKYAPDYYENAKELDEYTYVNGEKLFLGATRPRAYNYVTVIRKDWLDKCGLQPPKTDQEYLDMLRAFRDNKCGGEGTIPETKTLGNANYGNYAYREFPLPEKDNAMYSDITVCALTWEPTKRQLKDDNMKYNEGLVSPEWYLDTDGSKATEAFVSGKAGVYGMYLTKSPNIIANLKQNVPDAEVILSPTDMTRVDGRVTGIRSDNPFGMMTGININCEHPEAVMMYFEWMQDNIFTMQNGIEGVTYTMDGDVPILVDNYAGEERLNYNSNKDMWCLVTEGKDLGDEELNVKAQEKMYAPEGYEFLIRESYEGYVANQDRYYTDYIFKKPIESLTSNAETLKSKWQVIQTDLTNCKPEEFDALYEAACKEYLEMGYREVLDEKARVYEEEVAQK